MTGAVISAGVWLTPDAALAKAAPVVEAAPEKVAKKAAAPKPAPVPKEKAALDKARASLDSATEKLKAAQVEVGKAKGVSSKSNSDLNKAAAVASAAKSKYLDANDKLARMGKGKDSAVVAQQIKVCE